MNPAFEKHAAYMAQAWRTLQDSVLLKEGAADARHCQSQGCQAMVKPGNSYCAACLERGDATDAQGIDPDGNYGTGRNQ